MIKSKFSYDNRITNLSHNKNELHNTNENLEPYNTIYRIGQNESNMDEFENENENVNLTSIVEKIKIFHKHKALKNKEKTVKKLYHNEINNNKKEKKEIKVIRNKSKQRLNRPGLKLNISLDNLCITDRDEEKYDDIHCITMATTPKKHFTINYKNILNSNKIKTVNFGQSSSSVLKSNIIHKNKYSHQRNIKSTTNFSNNSKKNSGIFLTKQGNELDLTGVYSFETNNNYSSREMNTLQYLNSNQINKSNKYKRELKSQRGRSYNNMLLKENINMSNKYNTIKNIKRYNRQQSYHKYLNGLNDYLNNNTIKKGSSSIFRTNQKNLNISQNMIHNENNKSYKSLSKSKNNRKFFYPKNSINNNFVTINYCNKKINLKKNLFIDSIEPNKLLTLAPIIESNIAIENENCRLLENTISGKNKIVKKRKDIKDEQSKDECSTFRKNTQKQKNEKPKNIYLLTDENKNNNKLTFSNALKKLHKKPVKKSEIKSKNINLNNIKHHKNNNNIPDFIQNNNIKNKSRQKKINSRNQSIESSLSNFSNLSEISNSPIFNGKIEDYLITKELGKGSYATVKLAVHKKTKQKYAIKIYSKALLLDPQKRSTVRNEINILRQLEHKNIMKLYEVIDTSNYLYLVLEYIKGISLLELIESERNHCIEQNRALKIFLQIVRGISYCQSKNINHRDIKLENILVLEDDIVKIIDFGFAIKCNKDSYQKFFCGTPSYMAPEIVNKEKYIPQYSDIWSLGVLLFTMVYGRFPFRAKEDEQLFNLISEGNVIFPGNINVSDNIKRLIKKIINVHPILRPTAEEIIRDIIFGL